LEIRYKMMKRWVLTVFLIFCLPGLVMGLEVRFKEDAVAGADMLSLADVAEVRPAAAAAGLNGVLLFPAPDPGEQKCFQSRTLKAYVLDAVSDKNAAIEWGGADVVCVRHEGVLVSDDKLQSVIDSRLRAALSHLEPQQVSFKLRQPPDPLSLPPGRTEYEVLFSDRDILDSRQVSVIVKVDGRVVENLALAGKVRAFLPVVVAGRKLNRDTVITRGDVRTVSKNIADLRNPCVDLKGVVGKRLKRSVAVNEEIRRTDLDRPVLVERRQIVTMLLQKGTLQINARGQATADGKMGDVIMVRNMRSQREVPCEVIGSGLTRVDF